MSTALQASCDWCWDHQRQQVSQVERLLTPKLDAILRRNVVIRAGRPGQR
jgi:hypothetical protein